MNFFLSITAIGGLHEKYLSDLDIFSGIMSSAGVC